MLADRASAPPGSSSTFFSSPGFDDPRGRNGAMIHRREGWRDLTARIGRLSTQRSSSVMPAVDAQVVVIGAGVVGCATAMALARRGVSVAILEAEPEPALGASATNSGILHMGFDSSPDELETELLLASAALRDRVTSTLGIPVLRCGAVMRPDDDAQRDRLAAIAALARRNRVPIVERDGAIEIPGEAVTDPVRYTLALAGAAVRHGAELRTGWRVSALEPDASGLAIRAQDGESVRCTIAVNCAGLHADDVALLVGDDSFEIYPRKGEFLVFDPPEGEPLQRIILPVPTPRTKGVLVFPTLDGKVVAGPTAVDLDDKEDWSVRPMARDEILPKARAMYPPLAGAEPIAAYAGLRPAGRAHNYLIESSHACARLVNAAAIRSTGLSASLGIAERIVQIVGPLGVSLGAPAELKPAAPPEIPGPWWRRTADFRARVT
ncbi:MAG: FAD-dependent oxidoreductase [Actinomycetota bacterium]|nr:FAD-dependent oxidoreductase [Actinomycetota bacterium]